MADYAIHDSTLIAQANVIRKKFGTSDSQDPAEYADKMNLMGLLEEKTASSSSVCSFSDGADAVPLKNWLVTLPASLTGYTAIHGRKNTGTGTPETQYTASLGRTVYGGTADIVTGEGEDGYAKVTDFSGLIANGTSSTGAYRYRLNLTDCLAYSDAQAVSNTLVFHSAFNGAVGEFYNASGYCLIFLSEDNVTDAISALSGVEIVYPITPTPFTFTPIQADTELGVNNFWSDEGDTEVTYRSSGTVTPVVPTLITKSITENGTYDAEDDDADGYSSVTVNVQGGETPFVPLFTETKIADNSSHASSFTLSEDYGNYDMVKIVWYESASSSGFLYTTPDILDEIFSVGAGKLCINKPSTNYYICYSKSGLTWTQTNQRNIYVHEIYGVTFTNCTMTATDLYKRGASTTTRIAITSQTSLKDYDLFVMASIHATDGSETMPTNWLYQYPKENMSDAFDCPVPTVLQEYNANDEAFVISEYGMTAARYFMVQAITFEEVQT